jgi:glycosyltransferase involved in cell wall biosynthesis
MPLPKVSIGLPVYNGENYLVQAVQSVLDQTYSDFELLISDNASTDRTQEICERYAAQDPRIRYIRHEQNQGATWNFNYIFGQAQGEYFCWLAHDDKLAPAFLQTYAEVLDRDPETVLCFSRVSIIDENGKPITDFDIEMRTGSDRFSHRFYDLLMVWHNCFAIFGLIRTEALKKTPLIGAYGLGDAVLLARLGLMGKFYKADAPLFISRSHPEQSNRVFNIWVDHHAYDRWFTPNRRDRIVFPQWEVLGDLIAMVRQTKMSFVEKTLCYKAVLRWAVRYRTLLVKDCTLALAAIMKRRSGRHSEAREISRNQAG